MMRLAIVVKMLLWIVLMPAMAAPVGALRGNYEKNRYIYEENRNNKGNSVSFVIDATLSMNHCTMLYRMWYDGKASGHNNARIGYAASTDGITWTDQGQVMGLGSLGTWHDYGIYYLTVLKQDGIYEMWYSGANNAGDCPDAQVAADENVLKQDEIYIYVSLPEITNNISINGYFSSDSSFVEGELFDYHLQSTSPCIDVGDPNLDDDGYSRVYVMNLDETNLNNLTNHTANDEFPAWSPDGTKIAFISQRDGDYALYVMNADGSNPTPLLDGGSLSKDISSPTWSPDGTRIVFGYDSSVSNPEIYVINVDRTNLVLLVATGAQEVYPRWSPGGTKVLFSQGTGGSSDVYAINADGTNEINLTNLPSAINGHASWGILYHIGIATLNFSTDQTLTVNASNPNAC